MNQLSPQGVNGSLVEKEIEIFQRQVRRSLLAVQSAGELKSQIVASDCYTVEIVDLPVDPDEGLKSC